jgi:hypothetical protein
LFIQPRNILFLLLAMLICSPTFAEVKKWKDENGVIHYGDGPLTAGTERLKIDAKADKANAERIRRQTETYIENESIQDAKNSAQEAGNSANATSRSLSGRRSRRR